MSVHFHLMRYGAAVRPFAIAEHASQRGLFFQESDLKSLNQFGAAVLVACAGLLAGSAAAADEYPSRVVNVVVPYPPGGTIDRLGRDFAEHLRTRWGKPVIVVNRQGGDGIVGTEFVRRSPPDGYTLLIGGGTTHTVGPATDPEMKYDPIKDFTPIAYFGETPLVITAGPTLAGLSFTQMVAKAKAEPGKYTFGSVGASTVLVYRMLSKASGVDLRSVSYKQFGTTLLDIGRGDVDMGVSSLSIVLGNIQQKQLRPLAVTSRERSRLLPDVPAVAESYPGFEANIWFGLFAPAGIPDELRALLQKEVTAYQQTPGRAEKWAKEAFNFRARTGNEFAAYIKSDYEKWRALSAEAGLKRER
jgi:tripartite-type tricarboxylate transporter receptor subunit TctC